MRLIEFVFSKAAIVTTDTDKDNDIDIERMHVLARLAEISIPEAYETLTLTHLHTAATMAKIVLSTPIKIDELEPAPVFRVPETENSGKPEK
tara:strand:- start:1127 stop:1402 length:276 start_codon:yes stop_codon:yes gene_type:complete